MCLHNCSSLDTREGRMDSKIFIEECESSESGWTMYIGSSIDDDGEDSDSGDGGYDGACRRKVVVEVDDVDTDDSMASDASSGPGQQVGETEESQRRYNISSKKYKKAMHKKKVECEKIVGKGDDKQVVNDQQRVVTTLQSRNTAWFRGRKK